ncbi:MAG: phosphatidylglycerophosphatase A [Candidatus Kapabacteria bacterium]|nr:phosphatidylglycerophosphatase A [Candidatus Kapabacteria bacterium]
MILTKLTYIELFVSVMYLGKIKYAPGTFGSIAAFAVFLLPSHTIWYISLILAIVLTFLSLQYIGIYEKIHGDDHPSIVIDEVIGMLICFSNPYLIHNVFWLSLTLIMFRTFDILKPYPINKINQKKGAFFVIADDILAGTISLLIVQILQIGYGILPIFLLFY